jgi:putative membrane protein
MILHGGATGPVLLAWDFQPYMIFALVFAAGLYWLALRRIATRGVREVPRSYPVAYYAGLAAFAVAVGGPVETFNENSLSLHMAQHVILMLVAAPLFVLGRPLHIALWALEPQRSGAILRPVLRRSWIRGLLTIITHPVTVLLVININLVVWHLPEFYVAALDSTLIHELEHALFFGTAALFWWVIVDPIPRHHRVRSDVAIIMLFVSGSVGDLLALYLIFAPDVIYPFYLVNETIWGMSQLLDQRIAGLIMLVTGTAIYFGATFAIIARGYGNTAPVANTQHAHSGEHASRPA